MKSNWGEGIAAIGTKTSIKWIQFETTERSMQKLERIIKKNR